MEQSESGLTAVSLEAIVWHASLLPEDAPMERFTEMMKKQYPCCNIWAFEAVIKRVAICIGRCHWLDHTRFNLPHFPHNVVNLMLFVFHGAKRR